MLHQCQGLALCQWQGVEFRLPNAQHKAWGWWNAPPWLSGLCPWDFMPHTEASSTKDFQTMRQEKTLALACALQACTERSGMSTRVLCNSARELQRCMAPLMHLSGDKIVEASLWGPQVMNMEPSLLQRRKLPSWVRNPSHQRSPRPHPSQNAQRSLNPQSPQSRLTLSPQGPPSKLMLLVPLLLHPLHPQPSHHPSWKARKPWREIGVT